MHAQGLVARTPLLLVSPPARRAGRGVGAPETLSTALAPTRRVTPETVVPIAAAILVGLIGCACLLDAALAEGSGHSLERRRRARTERSRSGEATLGLGFLAVAAAIAGADEWRYSAVAAIAGGVLVILGAALNGRYIRDLVWNRGAARRREPGERLYGDDEV